MGLHKATLEQEKELRGFQAKLNEKTIRNI